MPFEYKEPSSESSSNEKLLEAKTFLENLGEDYEISKISHVTHRHVDMVVEGRRIWVLLEDLQPDAGFEFLVDDQDLTNQEEYRSIAVGLLERAQKIKDEETKKWYASATDFINELPESYEIEEGRTISSLAASGTVDGQKVWVNFVDGLHDGSDFELSIGSADFTNNEQYRAFALNFLNKVKGMKFQE